MIDLKGINLFELLPDSLRQDDIIAGIAVALNPELQEIAGEIDGLNIMSRIDELPENMIDCLAWQFHVDFYEPLGMDIYKKRLLVKNALDWHRRKGTKSVIQEMLQVLYSENCVVEEWFEYGGEPYHFRVSVNDMDITEQGMELLNRAIYELKNTRSWLERVQFVQDTTHCLYYGSMLRVGDITDIAIVSPPQRKYEVMISHGSMLRGGDVMDIELKEGGKNAS